MTSQHAAWHAVCAELLLLSPYMRNSGERHGGRVLAGLWARIVRSGLPVEAEQVALAVKLDMTYPKRQILRMYAAAARAQRRHLIQLADRRPGRAGRGTHQGVKRGIPARPLP